MSNNIRIELEDGTFDNDFIHSNYAVLIYLDNKYIGDIVGYATDEDAHIELISIEEKYRGLGYGTIAMNQFKEECKNLGFSYIYGDCPYNRMRFYKSLGAVFECRTEDDYTFVNKVFYIDL